MFIDTKINQLLVVVVKECPNMLYTFTFDTHAVPYNVTNSLSYQNVIAVNIIV